MKVFGNLNMSEGTEITNLTVDFGSSFPSDANVGELFCRNDQGLLYIYTNEWKAIANDENVVHLSGSETISGSKTFSSSTVISVNSSSNALRITQTGSGNCLVVEDSTNPDSSPFVIDGAGEVIIGYPNTADLRASSKINVWGGSTTVHSYTANNSSYRLNFNKSRSTSATTYTTVQAGDALGGIEFRGDDGTNILSCASIQGAAEGSISTGTVPGRITFWTATSGTLLERMRLSSDGNFLIGTTTNNGTDKLQVSGSANFTGRINIDQTTEQFKITRNSNEYITIEDNNTTTAPRFDTWAATTNAKILTFSSNTNSSYTIPTAGNLGFNFNFNNNTAFAIRPPGHIAGSTPQNYLQINSASTGSHPAIVTVGTDTNINLTLTTKGSGTINTLAKIVMNSSADVMGGGNIAFYDSVSAHTGRITSSSGSLFLQAGVDSSDTNGRLTIARSGTTTTPISELNVYSNANYLRGATTFGTSFGYGTVTGVGGTVTQATSKSTGVTLNKICGQITTHNETLNSTTSVGFTVTNSTIASTDVVIANIASGATNNSYTLNVDAISTGSFHLHLRNTSASNLSEALVINFTIIKSTTG